MALLAHFPCSVRQSAFPPFPRNWRRHSECLTQCSLRDKGLSKKPLWRTAEDMSPEAIQVSRSLKLASSDPSNAEKKLAAVFQSKITRLLKSDLLSLLSHLQRSDRCNLAMKVFEHARKETWYKPEVTLFRDMLYMLGRNKLVEEAEYHFRELQIEGLQPDSRVFTEMIGTYMEVGMVDRAMEMYGKMKKCGCKPTELTFTILINNLVRFEEIQTLDLVKRDVPDYINDGELFLKNLQAKNKGTSL